MAHIYPYKKLLLFVYINVYIIFSRTKGGTSLV